jgi:hypothetical protein
MAFPSSFFPIPCGRPGVEERTWRTWWSWFWTSMPVDYNLHMFPTCYRPDKGDNEST